MIADLSPEVKKDISDAYKALRTNYKGNLLQIAS